MGIGLLIVIVTLIGGAVLSAQSSINGTISRNIGLLETVFFTFASGTLILAVLINFWQWAPARLASCTQIAALCGVHGFWISVPIHFCCE